MHANSLSTADLWDEVRGLQLRAGVAWSQFQPLAASCAPASVLTVKGRFVVQVLGSHIGQSSLSVGLAAYIREQTFVAHIWTAAGLALRMRGVCQLVVEDCA